MTLSQIYLFNFEKLTTFKTTIRNKLLRNSSWIRYVWGSPSPHYVILISNIIWDHVVDIFCVLIFPHAFSNGHLLLLYLVSTPLFILQGATFFCQQLQFYWGFNCVILHFLLRKKHELQVDQKRNSFLDLFTAGKTRPIRKVIFSVGWMWEGMAYLSVTLHSVIKVVMIYPALLWRGPACTWT